MRIHDFLTACIISLSLGSPAKSDDVLYDFDPIYLGAVGHFQPLDFYPVAVAIDHDNNVYEVDLFRKKVRIHDVTGSIIDEFPTGNGWFRDIDIDAAGNIYVADTSGRIRKYGSNGELLLQFGFRGTTPGGFTRLRAMTIGHDGTIYVADKDTELSAFDSDGNLIWNNMKTVTPDGDLIMPLGITQDSLGNLYVADVSRNDVAIFNSAGQYLRNIKPNGNDYDPVAVAVDAEDTLYVLERRQYETHIGDLQIRKFTSNGEQLGAWAAKGRAPGELWEPQGMTLGPDGSIWVAGYMGHNIVRYDTSGNLISEWNDHDIKPYEFARVRGAVVGNNGDLYVTDFWNQVVQVFDRYGAFRFMFGERGQGDGQYFNFPRHTAANNAGDIFISDDGMIRRFAADGSFIARSEDAIPFAGGIEVDQLENVWVIGQSENTLRRYSQTLVLQEIIDGTEIPLGLNSPWGIAQGPNGKLYIADTLNHRIVRLTSTGLFDMAWGSRGVSPGQFSAPKGIVIDSHGYVYVSEEWNKRIQVFSADGDYLNGWDVPGVPDKDVGRPYELTLDGDYFLYAPDTTFGQAEVHKYALVPTVSTSGQPAYVSGEELGFYIWSENGSDWRIRWSSDGVLQEFSGTITSTTPIINFNNIDSEPGDQAVQKNSTRIDFTATETNGQDGIDIGISGEGIITFDLKIGGIERAHLVTIGSTSFHPSTLPVPLRTQAVSPVNDPPMAQDDSASVNEGESININVAENDSSVDDALDLATINIITGPMSGDVSVRTDGTLDYYTETEAGATGDTFTYTISDVSGAASNIATVSVSITPSPASNGRSITEEEAIALGLDSNDPDGDTDDDGMSDIVEIGGDTSSPLDTDGDGVIDALEPGADAADAGIVSGLILASGDAVTISTAAGESLSQVGVTAVASASDGVEFLFGTISYTTSSPPGGSVTVGLTFFADLPENLVVYKVDSAGNYTELPTSIWTRVGARMMDITLTDGDPMTDLDGVVNGSIDDPIALGSALSAATSGSMGADGGGGGCVFNPAADKDPIFPALMLFFLIYLYRGYFIAKYDRQA